MNFAYLKHKYHESFVVDPSDLRNPTLTKIYKNISGRLKVMPFLYLIPLSVLLIVGVSLLFGLSVVKVATLLQNGL